MSEDYADQVQDMLNLISDGKVDQWLDQFVEVVQFRKRMMAKDKFWSWNVGDRVKFVRTVRPQYLAGRRATIMSRRTSKFLIKLDEPAGRFASQIVCPPGILEKVV